MNVILFLEHKFYFDENEKILYSQKVINDKILSRYTEVFGKVIICARKMNSKDSS